MIPLQMGLINISGAYLQSGLIRRTIYVRPPKELTGVPMGSIWQLTKLSYGITEAGHQWVLVMEYWMLNYIGMERVYEVSQLFVKRGPDGFIQLILANKVGHAFC